MQDDKFVEDLMSLVKGDENDEKEEEDKKKQDKKSKWNICIYILSSLAFKNFILFDCFPSDVNIKLLYSYLHTFLASSL